MNNLREAVDRLLEAGIKAVDEDENPAPRRALDARIEVRLLLSEVHPIGAEAREVRLMIGWQRRRKPRVPWLAAAGRQDRHDDIGEIRSSSPGASEHDARRLEHRRARRRHQEIDLARAWRARPDNERAVGTA